MVGFQKRLENPQKGLKLREEILSASVPAAPFGGLIKARQLRKLLGDIAKTTLDKWLDLPDFPQPVIIPPHRYWVLDEIVAWIGKQPRRARPE